MIARIGLSPDEPLTAGVRAIRTAAWLSACLGEGVLITGVGAFRWWDADMIARARFSPHEPLNAAIGHFGAHAHRCLVCGRVDREDHDLHPIGTQCLSRSLISR
jgi:hypothetical protein